MKFGKRQYYKPTPYKLRRLGDALLGVSLISIPMSLAGNEVAGYILLGFGIVGKFLTNYFSESNEQGNQNANN